MKNKNINKIKSYKNNYFRYIISNIQCLVINDFFNDNPLLTRIDNYLGDIKSIDNSGELPPLIEAAASFSPRQPLIRKFSFTPPQFPRLWVFFTESLP